MTIIVTGCSGFLGCHVAIAVHGAGDDCAVVDVNDIPPALQDAGIRGHFDSLTSVDDLWRAFRPPRRGPCCGVPGGSPNQTWLLAPCASSGTTTSGQASPTHSCPIPASMTPGSPTEPFFLESLDHGKNQGLDMITDVIRGRRPVYDPRKRLHAAAERAALSTHLEAARLKRRTTK